MSGKQLSFAVLMLLSVMPEIAQAQGRTGLFHHRRGRFLDPCGTCAAPALPDPGCCGPMLTPQAVFAPQPEFCTQMQPVVETCMVPQQCTTFRDVPQVCYRQEPFCQTVPVTTTRQGTVDEGCYQMVWVPRMVTRSVPQTTYQQQLAFRTVAVQSTARIPVTETRMVPQQRVRYVPQTVPVAPGCCGGSGVVPPGIPPLGPATLGPIAPMDMPSGVPSPGSTIPSLPPAGLDTPSPYSPPSAPAPTNPVPAGKDPSASLNTSEAEGEWSTIQRRAAFFESEFGYRPFGGVRTATFSNPNAERLWQ
jgi:hypothetical protein